VIVSKKDHHTIVIGAGVIGVNVAYYLAKRGAQVTVVEKGEIGMGASFGNAGAIALGHTPMNKPGRVKQALKSMFDPLGPLYLKPRFDPSLFRWLWAFRSYCGEERLLSAVKLLGSVGHQTGTLFAQLVEEEKLCCNYTAAGYYEIYKTEPAFKSALHEAKMSVAHGYHPETVSGDELREIEPSIRDDILGGVFFRESATVDPYRFVFGLADAARKHGVTFRENCEVSEVLTRNGAAVGLRLSDGEVLSAEHVVIAAGAYSRSLTRKLGIPLPLQAAKGYHCDRSLAAGGTPALGNTFMLGERSVFCTPMGDFLRLAGTLEFSGLNENIYAPRLAQLTKSAKEYLKGMEDVKPTSEWCGLRPCLPDGYPAVGPVPAFSGLYIATGHAMLGLTLGPITGQVVAEMVLDGTTTNEMREFRVDRF
jgi:D-amino-acid dehydrogenase